MDEQPIAEMPNYPCHTKTFAIPNDDDLKRAYKVYKPSAETLQLLSEQNRTIFPELFIENDNLGTLQDLCAAVLARSFGPSPFPLVEENPLLLQRHYDALDVDLPLEKCFDINAERFWKRVVLAKHPDKTLALKKDINWKNLALSLKFVELIEKCSVEYWPGEEIRDLALKVKQFITEMHIKRLLSLKDRSFEKYFLTESEESSTEEESSFEDESESIETSAEEEGEKELNEELEESESQLRVKEELANEKALRKRERQVLREEKQKAREIRRAKRQEREARKLAPENTETKPRKKKTNNLFEMKVSDSEDEGEDRIVDKRNKSLYLKHYKRYNYPDNDCHHIDLSFVQYLTNLENFTLEFWAPLQGRFFHKRHQKFSLNDIKNLAQGLSYLHKLKIFRLRNSCMDAEKLETLCRVLAVLPSLETLDFGFDKLKDDCCLAFEELFKVTNTIQNLELESNFLGEQTLHCLGIALNQYTATELSYLGLARNPLTDNALHALVIQILDTNHIKHLSIKGATFLTESGLCCCLANELLRKHPTLIKLDICALQISSLAADEIVNSLNDNETILEINCSDSGLDLETEIDITTLLKRNKYISEHYYLGDPSVTKEEITTFLNSTRNPILLKVFAERENRKKCLENRDQLTKRISNLIIPTESYDTLDMRGRDSEYSSSEIQVTTETREPFVYPANDFNEEEFLEHIYQPGPQERYYYLKSHKQKYSIKDNVKNKTII